MFDAGVGDGCECWIVKPAIEDIQVISQFTVHCNVGGVSCGPLHTDAGLLAEKLLFSFSV